MPYVVVEKNCFRCVNLGTSDDRQGTPEEELGGPGDRAGALVVRRKGEDFGYVCKLGFGRAKTIWTGHLALICPYFEARGERGSSDEEY